MNGLTEFLKGKKTYIVAIVTVGLGVAQAFGLPIAPWVYPLMGAFGLGTLRAGVNKVSQGIDQNG